jgi:uncharacterized protein (TIGR03435 family)
MKRRMNIPHIARLSGATAIALLVLSAGARGQATHQFEVAAIRPVQNASGGNTSINAFDGGLLRITNITIKFLILASFRIQKDQLAGGPAWIETDRFDIEAKTGRPEKIPQDQLPMLLQSLLDERFHLKFHREMRELPVYALVVDKGSPKLMKADGSSTDMQMSRGPGTIRLAAAGVSMKSLTANLGFSLGRIVLDQTGLTENYNLKLEWASDEPSDVPAPSIFTALREQLGLRLESRRAPVDVYVIDKIEKPSAN